MGLIKVKDTQSQSSDPYIMIDENLYGSIYAAPRYVIENQAPPTGGGGSGGGSGGGGSSSPPPGGGGGTAPPAEEPYVTLYNPGGTQAVSVRKSDPLYNQYINSGFTTNASYGGGSNPGSNSYRDETGNAQTIPQAGGSNTPFLDSQPDKDNPWAGIPAEISQNFDNKEEAQRYWDSGGSYIGTTGPSGIGSQPLEKPSGTKILNEDDLQEKRNELSAAGVPQNEWSKYISSPGKDGSLYWSQPATLYNPKTGEKKVVATGSSEASSLLSNGWSLGDGQDTNTITSNDLKEESDIDVGNETYHDSGDLADRTTAGIKVDIEATDAQIQKYLDILTPPETDLSRSVDELLGSLDPESLTGRGSMQLAEEERRGIEEKSALLAEKNKELKKKVAEIDALTANYNLANQTAEGKTQTMFSIQGAQAQNYKMYLANKNVLVAEAGFLQAEVLGLQGQIDAAQKAADRAVDLEYMDREASYNAKIAQLNILIPQLEKEEKRYGQAALLVLQKQAEADAEAKAEKKNIQKLWIDAINAGMDAKAAERIGKAKTLDEALAIYGENKPKDAPETRDINGKDKQWNPLTGEWEDIGGSSRAPIPMVEPSGAMQTMEYNGRALSLDATTGDSLSAINKQASALGGLQIGAVATSTFRTREQQQKLYDAYLAGGPLAAPPGQSAHEKGMAIDLKPDQKYIEQMRPIMEANGWYQTAGSNDKGHFEYMGKQSAGNGSPAVQEIFDNFETGDITYALDVANGTIKPSTAVANKEANELANRLKVNEELRIGVEDELFSQWGMTRDQVEESQKTEQYINEDYLKQQFGLTLLGNAKKSFGVDDKNIESMAIEYAGLKNDDKSLKAGIRALDDDGVMTKDQAREKGFYEGAWWGIGEKGITKYKQYLIDEYEKYMEQELIKLFMQQVEQKRKQGKTDDEIYDSLT